MNKDNKKFVVETLFLKEVLKYNLTLNEFIILMYFDNEYDGNFDVTKVSKATSLSVTDVLDSFNSLIQKKIITIDSEKDESGKIFDRVSLDNIYNDSVNVPKEEPKEDFFSVFEKKYGHSLSGYDYEIVNAWIGTYDESLILAALDEAIYNGVTALRYIDKILYDWNSKGITKKEDIKQGSNNDVVDESLLEYDWLDED